MVSAIITTYKREPRIVLRALNSILSQTYKDIEIIIVDDSPEDYPERLKVKKVIMDKQRMNKEIEIRYIAHVNNMGACKARNSGLYVSKGEYIAYLDDDDEWLPQKIEKQIKVIEKGNASLVYCRYLRKNEIKSTCEESQNKYYRGKVLFELLNENFIGSTSFPLIKKECLLSIGGFDPLMQAAQDYDVWLRMAEKYEVDYVDEPLVIYHEHVEDRITTNVKKRISGTERLCEKFASYLDEDRKIWWKRHLGLCRQYMLNGDKHKAYSLWRECVSKCPERIKDNTMMFYLLLRASKESRESTN